MTTVADPDEHLTHTSPIGDVVPDTEAHIELIEHYSAHNYHPLPIVVAALQTALLSGDMGETELLGS